MALSAAFEAPTSVKPTLENLPTELVEAIVHELDEEDLLGFRLVSAQCAKKSEKVFANTWWSEVQVRLFDKSSVESAIAHLDHDVYGTAARKIIIYIDEWLIGDAYPFRIAPSLASEETLSAALMYSDYARSGGKSFLVQLLKPIFYRLVLFGRVDEVCIAWGGCPILPQANCLDLPKQSFQNALSKYWGPPETHNGLAFLSILEAMSTSCFKPATLTMRNASDGEPREYGFKDCRWGMPLNSLLEGPTLGHLKNASQNLTTLQLDVWAPRFDISYDSVFGQIAAIPNLAHLDLNIHNPAHLGHAWRDVGDPRATDSFLRATYPALKTLDRSRDC